MDNSPLGKLSAELRNEVYRLVVSAEKPLVVCKNHSAPELSAVQPALTRTCRQIREESLGMFYHANTFVMELITTMFWGDYVESDSIHQRTKEVSAWLQCTSQKHHDTIRHSKLVICKPEIEDAEYTDWRPLAQALKQCGYAREGQNQKLDAVVHNISEATDYADYEYLWRMCYTGPQIPAFIQGEKEYTRRFFSDLGLNVEADLQFLPSLHFERCGNCQGMLDLLSARVHEEQ
ncbi:hypothetical protein CKM354_001018600 [Cercospora kikuchii]|uniref:Uncharacterized protein n=1 Tax=Cercospora kikuchii TaxID=84275 RepID=A0A9P3FKS1_9PEZI|nr:uncharacterized protein CKM354_001018600 [Cercospora kikuchii]GIZ47085.1 hypothetical protein CKM354_001018600 [Cercospora kikuchii]